MAIVQSVDGKFYEIPDDQLDKFLVPEDKVKEKLDAAAGSAPPPGPPSGPPPSGGSPTIVVQIFGARPDAGPPPSGPPPSGPPPGVGAPPPGAEVVPYNWHNHH